jgi:Tol biopolymer transport system component
MAFRRLIKTCLAKDPEERWQTAHDVGLQLRGIAEGGPEPKAIAKPTRSPKKGSDWLAWMLATVALLLALGLGLALGPSYFEKRSVETSLIRFELYPPEKSTFDFAGFASAPVAVSPDGRMLAFGGRTPEGKTQLWVRPLDNLAAQALPETDGASYPFWSPDSRSVGFFAQGKLKRIEVAGGSPRTLCEAPSAQGGTWNQQGVIVFAPDQTGPLCQVSAFGGIPKPVTVVSTPGDLTQRWPWFLPDGRHFLYLSSNPRGAAGGDEGLYVGSLESKETHRLMLLRSNAVFENGELLYLQDRTLVAQPFDAKTLKIAGEPIPLVHSVAYAPATLRGVFSASGGELLAYATSPAPSGTQLIWYDRQGKQIETLDESVVYYSPELSPDGKQLAVDILEPGTGNVDIWLYQLGNNLKTRFTFGTSVNMSPVWAPDGTQIAFASNRKGFFDLYTRPVNSSGEDEFLLQTNSNKNPTDWSPDGRYLLFEQRDPVQMTKTEIGVLPLFGDRKPFILVASSANVREARFDPSGHWVAYTSDETGRNEVYLTSFPNPGSLRQVSTAGGENPLWGRDGKEIYYLSPDLQMMVAEVNGKGSTLEIGAVRSLFSTHAAVQLMAAPYAVSGDGQKFLIDSLPQANPSSLTIVVNGMTALKASRPGYPQ